MKKIAGVTHVIFDPMQRRFEGQVFLAGPDGRRTLNVSTPGHACWDHRRIKTALIASARAKAKELRHARA